MNLRNSIQGHIGRVEAISMYYTYAAILRSFKNYNFPFLYSTTNNWPNVDMTQIGTDQVVR